MRLFTRTTRITALRRHLLSVREGLCAIESKPDYVPSPDEMKALQEIRRLLDELAYRTDTLEPQLWQRIETWCNTPWTSRQRRIRNIAEFISWWLAGTMALSYSVLGWFTPLFPEPWYVLPVSAILAARKSIKPRTIIRHEDHQPLLFAVK